MPIWEPCFLLSSENRHKLRFQTDHFQQRYKMFPLTKLSVTFGRLSCSVGKESICNAGDPSSIPGSGRSGGKGIGYPLQYSWVSLMAQLVKDLSAVQEAWVQSLGWEDPLEKGKTTHSSILAWRIPWTIQSMRSQSAGHDFVSVCFYFGKKLSKHIHPRIHFLKGYSKKHNCD